jgi:DNA-binding transcriptional ArsR family regulator
LAEPSSRTALARTSSLTLGAISQHLSILRACGLVSRARIGRSVPYQRTRTADNLLG